LLISGGRGNEVKDLFSWIVGITQRAQLSMCQRVGKREAISPVEMDVMVNQRREALNVFGLNQHAGGAKFVQRQAHVARIP